MYQARVMTISFIVIVLSTLLMNQQVSALSCAEPHHPLEEMRYSDIVFKGVFLSQSKDKLNFEVSRVWKGEIGDKITIYENYWTGFTPGQEYIVFVGVDNKKLRPKLCGNTGVASQELEAQLGEPVPISQQQSERTFFQTLSIAIVLIVVIGFILLWLPRRRK